MTEIWLTARQIADLRLPGLPETKVGVLDRAKRENWPFRERRGRGGGREYPVSGLPEAARKGYARRQLRSGERAGPPVPAPAPAEAPAAPPAPIKGWQRRTAEARAALLREVERLRVSSGLSQRQAIELLVGMARSGALRPDLAAQVPAANARAGAAGATGAAGGRTLSARTLARWLAAERGGALAPREAAPARAAVPGWASHFWRLWAQPQKWSIAHCLERLALPEGMAAPSYDQVKRFLRQVSAIDRNRGRMGPRQMKTMRAYVTRDYSDLWPTAIYSSDGHTFDAEVAHPIHGQPFRPEVTTAIDVATRKIVGWSAGIVENTWGVADAMRHACETHGVPAIWYVDRGRGFNNDYFDHPATGFLPRLGVIKENSLPYASQSRGVEERSHRSCLVRAAKELPTYIGQWMDAEAKTRVHKRTRSDIKAVGRSRLLLPFDEFQAFIGQRIEEYNNRRHSELGMSPCERWEKLLRDQPDTAIDRLSEAEADDLFRPTVERVARRGQVELWTNIYFLRDLEHHHGETVHVGFDLHDASRVWISTPDGRRIGIARLDGNKRPYMPALSRAEREQQIRTKGRKGRLQQDLAVVEAELTGGPALIEHKPAATVDEVFLEAARRQLELVEAAGRAGGVSAAPPVSIVPGASAVHASAAAPTAAPAVADGAASGARPVFGSDADFAAWLSGHPGEATARDVAWLRPRLADPHFLLLLDVSSIDVEPLRSLLREEAA